MSTLQLVNVLIFKFILLLIARITNYWKIYGKLILGMKNIKLKFWTCKEKTSSRKFNDKYDFFSLIVCFQFQKNVQSTRFLGIKQYSIKKQQISLRTLQQTFFVEWKQTVKFNPGTYSQGYTLDAYGFYICHYYFTRNNLRLALLQNLNNYLRLNKAMINI